MADRDGGGQAAPSGRGGGRAGAGARKFLPTMPGRRKKAEEGGGLSAAEAAASDDTFKDLIKQAQSASGPGGRGRGRGRVGQQRFQVTFCNYGDDRPALAAAKQYPRSSGHGAGGPGGKATGGGGGGGGGGGSTRVKSEGAATGPGDDDIALSDLPDAKRDDMKVTKPRVPVLDYTQYYPTVLPLRLPGEEIWEEAAEAGAFQPSSLDLASVQDVEQRPATDLDLFDPEVEDQMFLMQMPTVMPLGGGAASGGRGEGEGGPAGPGPSSERRRAAAAAAVQGRGGPGSDLRDLGSGRIGKLLVFKSGKVKLKVGEVLLDVSIGLPNQHRQDVVAVNPSSNACVLLGDVHQRVIVAPDVMQLLAEGPQPAFRSAPEELPELTEAHRQARGYEAEGGLGEGGVGGPGVKGFRLKAEQR